MSLTDVYNFIDCLADLGNIAIAVIAVITFSNKKIRDKIFGKLL